METNRRMTRSGLCLMVVMLAVLTAPTTTQKPALDDFSVSVPDAPITAWSGSSVSLPCELSPLFNAEPLEVRWYRSENSYSPALLYKDHKIQEAPVDPRYRVRVSLTGGLERGNVSLTLERVTLEDRGEYVCRVSSEQWFDKASVFLTVNVLGSIPVLSVAEARGGGGQVNVTCSSEGWSPQPKLSWKNKEGTEIRNEQEVLNTSDPQGLVNVSSWLLYAPSYSDWLACTVSLSEEAKREGRILPHTYTAPTAAPGVYKEAFIVTLILLVLSLVIICALCSVILWKRRGSMWSSSQKSRNRSDQTELGQRLAETKNLIEGEENTIPRPTDQRAAGKEVNLEETKNLIQGAENTIPRPTDQRAAGKEVNLEETKKRLEGAENTVPTPPKQKAAGKELNLEGAPLGAETTVKTPTEHIASGKEVNLKDWHQVKGFKENIILDEKTAHPAIRVFQRKRARYIKEKDTENPSVRMHLHVFSQESFSSGRHYWEVKDQSTKKLSWYVGVARENVERRSTVPLTPQNGFWILSYDKEKGFHVNTDPQPPITVAELARVGVFLDCDRHTLSFYNVDTESLLYTFTDVKTSNYLPVFSPGQRDRFSIRII
ncbi:butyrophilin subfamily 2 member A2-like isoform X2 [Salvelinus fontinalis]|uniref:butyrophilin subfamily 2 member A2-like isoform X2 n=1 Tax=Salvelinus fontinalis TaxID=8038 RepID=UPI002485FC46|nr:butyrophilin subfamily 2 member A2-like isoform X2 [Salvelinus fontinalis]